MELTPVDSVRRGLVLAALIVGPLLAAASAAIGLGLQPKSMHAAFDLMAQHGSTVLAQDLLELFGFTILAIGAIGVTRVLGPRGSWFGLTGALLSLLGIVGFSVSNASGLAIVGLAQLPDRAAAFDAAAAITAGGPLALISSLGWYFEIIGQVGGLVIILALWRARVIPWWPAVVFAAAMIAVAVIGSIEASLAADVVLLAIMVFVVIRAAQLPRPSWARQPTPA